MRVKESQSGTGSLIRVTPYRPGRFFYFASATALVLLSAFVAALNSDVPFLEEIPTDLVRAIIFLFTLISFVIVPYLFVGWMTVLSRILERMETILRVDQNASELHLSQLSSFRRGVGVDQKIPLSAIRKVWFDRGALEPGHYLVGLDLEGKDRYRIIDRNLNEGEMQSLTLALERALGVKAE